MIKITFHNDKKVHIQSDFLAGSAKCGKDAFSWHHSKRDVTCELCLSKEKTLKEAPNE